ncbi:selenium-binding protein [Brevibacillus borstelensis]|uniref:selenium-binding protein n=1 Tax=Brevibacillus borstelensis TaxID=45462 RepID=UPI00203CBF42|nr:selenium-binding protein [Brevibacillus borstelensis]MCM3594011.1 selenium-binding protein [Brevibacillus borstelensis]
MGIFGGKKETSNESRILVITSDHLNRDYEPLGTVIVTSAKVTNDFNFIVDLIGEKAKEQGADAVICFRYNLNGALYTGYGTAVKFK